MRHVILACVFLALGAAAHYVYEHQIASNRSNTSRASQNDSDLESPAQAERQIVALGRLEPAGGVVSVAAPPGEWLEALKVSEGDVVEKLGDSLGLLASHALRKAELEGLRAQREMALHTQSASEELAVARLAQAEIALKQAKSDQARLELKKQEIQLLSDQAELSKSDYDKLVELQQDDEDLVSQQQLKRQKLAWQTAEETHEQAVHSHAVAEKAAALAIEAAEADVRAAKANLKQAQSKGTIEALDKQIEAAAVQERWARLPAPTTGTVLKVFVQPGEFVTQMPILQIADLTNMVCVAEVFEADAKLIKKDNVAVINSTAFAAPYDSEGIRATVTRIGRLISTPGISDRNPLSQADRHVIEVRLQIDRDDTSAMLQAARLVGLQADVQFIRVTNKTQGNTP